MNFDVLPQVLANGLSAGALYALVATGLALFFGILKFINFAHGRMAMIAAYIFLTLFTTLDWSSIPSFLLSLVFTSAIGLLILYLGIFPAKDAPKPVLLLVISIGIAIILENLVLMIWGSRVYSLGTTKTFSLAGGKILLTDAQLFIFLATIILFIFLVYFLKKTKMGKAIRAVSDSKEIAAILGISVTKILVTVFLISTLFAAVAGMLAGFDQNLNPRMGLFLTVKAAAAVILGGMGSVSGAILGSLIIGLAENILIGISIGGFYIPSGYKDAIAFIILILVLYARPQGIFGGKTEELVRAA